MATKESARPAEESLARSEIVSLGRLLFEAEEDSRAVSPITTTHPEMTVADAYAIQLEYARLRMESGARLVGHKIGATSKAIQELFGIDTPDYGHLFDDMRCDEEGAVPVAQLIQPLVEPEIAFVLAKELSGPDVTAEEVISATHSVVACIEIIDSRISDWQIKLPDTVSDNGSSARFIIGSVEMPVSFDLAEEAVVMERNGEVVGRGNGAAVLGHPATSVAWLANALAAFGGSLPAGSIALSGSMTSAVEARPGDEFTARFTNLGAVRATFATT